MIPRTILFWGLLVVSASGQEPPVAKENPEAAQVVRVMRPDSAVAVAFQDAQQLAAIDPTLPLRTRWVMVNDPDPSTFADISLAANIAHLLNSEPVRPIPLAGGAVYRIDLAEFYGSNPSVLRLALDTWDRMKDTQFYQPTDETKVLLSPWYLWQGKRYNKVSIRVAIPHVSANPDGQLASLIELTGSTVPILSIGQYFRFCLNSVDAFYPEFRQFTIAPEKGTAEQVFLLRAGVDLNKLGDKNSDQRVICWGTPTANPRIVEYMPAAITRPVVGPTICSITRDFFVGPIGQDAHALENLPDRKHDGTEIFLPTPAGGLEFGLFDGNGGFVRSAPDRLARDRTVPNGFNTILQGPSGCIRCHITTNPKTLVNAIYQPAPNYVKWLRDTPIITPNGPVRFDVFQQAGDTGDKLKRLVSLYNGTTDDAFGYAGRTFAKFVFDATGTPVEDVCKSMMVRHDAWLYDWVTPKKALLTLGYKVETEEQAVLLFNTICPPTYEPNRIGQIRTYKEATDDDPGRPYRIPIDDWLAVYPEVALRVQAYEAAQAQAGQPQQSPPKEEPPKEEPKSQKAPTPPPPAKKAA